MKRAWAWPGELRRAGVLGINRRNLDLVLPHNPRANFPSVDDKLLTKQLCEERGISVPRTLAIIARQGDIQRFATLVIAHTEFVIKPASGRYVAGFGRAAPLTPEGLQAALGA